MLSKREKKWYREIAFCLVFLFCFCFTYNMELMTWVLTSRHVRTVFLDRGSVCDCIKCGIPYKVSECRLGILIRDTLTNANFRSEFSCNLFSPTRTSTVCLNNFHSISFLSNTFILFLSRKLTIFVHCYYPTYKNWLLFLLLREWGLRLD